MEAGKIIELTGKYHKFSSEIPWALQQPKKKSPNHLQKSATKQLLCLSLKLSFLNTNQLPRKCYKMLHMEY
jgi:hypothetical protein